MHSCCSVQLYKKRSYSRFLNTAQCKNSWTKNKVEGDLKPGSRVVVVDDVTSWGNSIEEAITEVQKLGCKIVGLLTLVDREEGAQAKLEGEGFKFEAVFKNSDFKKQA